jgi:polar amino acid transport system substrate-binding protein
LALSLFACGGSPSGGEATTTDAGGGATASYLIEAGKLHVGLEPEYPPMEFKTDSMELTGFDVDFIKAIGEQLGLEVVFHETAWDAIFIGLESRQYDIVCSSVSITQERLDAKRMGFSNPYMNNGQYIIVEKGAADINQLTDLAGLVVGVQTATTSDEACEKYLASAGSVSFDLRKYDAVSMATTALSAGQLDVVVCDAMVAIDFVNKNPEKFDISTAQMTNEPIAIATVYGNQELIDLLNPAIKTLSDAGKLSELSIKYILRDETQDIDTNLK